MVLNGGNSLEIACNGGVVVAFGGAIAQLGERVVRNDEVGGSIPPGSTNLRSIGASAGKPTEREGRARQSFSEGGLKRSNRPDRAAA